MTPSFTESKLPQTGSSGRIETKMLQEDPHPGLREISYKRHFTRSTQDFDESVRVMLFTDPYLKLNAEAQAADDTNADESKIYKTNSKVWVHDKTCFDFELNSTTADAGKPSNWQIALTTIKDQKSHDTIVELDKKFYSGKNGRWFQYTGIICALDKLDPTLGIDMVLMPNFRENKSIELKWEAPI
jgi:hypothetical protein